MASAKPEDVRLEAKTESSRPDESPRDLAWQAGATVAKEDEPPPQFHDEEAADEAAPVLKTTSSPRTLEDREKLADGLVLFHEDPNVPPSKRTAIRVVRSVVYVLLCIAGWTGLIYLAEAGMLVRVGHEEHYRGEVLLDFCNASGAVLTPEADVGWDLAVANTDYKVMTFQTVIPDALNYPEGLPNVSYYHSEPWIHEIYHEARAAFTFGLFNEGALIYNLTLTDSSCLTGPAEADAALNRLGEKLEEVLEAAEQRPAEVLQMYHSVMLREDNRDVWDPQTGSFSHPYAPTQYWIQCQAFFAVAVVALTWYGLRLLFYFITDIWSSAFPDWIIQYDHLWSVEELFNAGTRGSFTALNMCSTFFIIDDAVGDAYKNEEQWGLALLSSTLHALAVTLPILLPALSFVVFPMIPTALFYIPLALHVLTQLPFGVAYYFGVTRGRQYLLIISLVSECFLLLWAAVYIVAMLVFFCSLLVSDAEDVAEFAVQFGSIVVYAVVVTTELQNMQQHYKDATAGKAPKGTVTQFIADAHLQTKDIAFMVLNGVVPLVLLVLFLHSFAIFYAEDTTIESVVAALLVPLSALTGGRAQLNSTRQAAEDKAAMISQQVTSVI